MPHSSIGRREFVASSATLAGATLAGATLLGLSAACDAPSVVAPPSPTAPLATKAGGETGDLAEPRVIAGIGGILTASLAIETRPVTVAGRVLHQPVTYGGALPAPTLWVRPGQVIDLTFANRIVFDQAGTRPGYGRPPRHASATNVHFHGMHVTPIGTGDDMTVAIPALGAHRYLFEVPSDHPGGLFWYHAHVHELTTNHVGRGAAGMIYVANAHTDQVAQLGIRRRLMMLQQIYLGDDGRTIVSDDGAREDPTHALSLINGQLMPEIRMRPGEPQVWSLLNASTSAFYALRLAGHTFDVIADDGVPLRHPGRRGLTTLVIPSGKRLEVVVRASATAGRYTLSYDELDQGIDTWPKKDVGTVVVAGQPWTGPDHPGVDTTAPVEDLSGVHVPAALRRTIVFGENSEIPEGEHGRFTMNGRAYDPAWREWVSTLGTVEEWHITNETNQDHPFHVHTNPFQITKRNGIAVPFDGHQDTATVPRFGSMTVRTRFTDYPGWPILMHCHILDHEDMGMMTSFEIVRPPGA